MSMLIDRVDDRRGLESVDMVGAAELAREAGMDASWVRRLIERAYNPDFHGRFFIPAVKVGNSWVVKREVAEVFWSMEKPGPGKSYDNSMGEFAMRLDTAGLADEARLVRRAILNSDDSSC